MSRMLKKYCLTTITDIYGCQWKKKQSKSNKKRESIWFIVLSCGFALSIFWFYCWWALLNDYSNLNEHFFGFIHRWLDWSVILLFLAATIFSYLFLLMILAVCHFVLREPLYLHWINKVAMLVCIFLILVLMIVIRIQWKEEWDAIHLSIQVTAPFFHIGAVAGVTIVAWFIVEHILQSKKRVFQIVLSIFYLGVVIFLYLIPLAISSPCIIENEYLGPKPALMGHRGAPMLAPENTLMSFEKTVECNASTFETDVQISFDGVPFLMHDNTFERTTDIKEKFPKRVNDESSSFTWAEIQQLNAGEWFLKKKPYNTVQSLPKETQQIAEQQKVSSLAEVLKLAKKTKKYVIFDLRTPSNRSHPYYNTSHNAVIETILNSTIDHNQILWLPNHKNSTPPGFQQVLGEKLDPEKLQQDKIHIINIRYSNISEAEIRKYATANISTNVYVVNERWVFSTLWCAKVKSVTTNACHIFNEMAVPIWHLSPKTYLAIWLTVDFVSLLVILLVCFFQRSRHRRLREFNMSGDNEETIL
ncbi:glycerophosphodiester phosphodiesterase domain-containing protein 5 isoform X2 [Leucoraja erinacea]|uniref:glycerophosphodiester phosphodiesterase domain-containing protein 5 isoform X2 n=1 Tax=Leucoraja erinaceus TaxID=7782 RepID=UPI00245842DD|nr:glycerophosphodiester phosphodiesterase domain-containing protein 5 isoform X2 [Leucoraja erinacea]